MLQYKLIAIRIGLEILAAFFIYKAYCFGFQLSSVLLQGNISLVHIIVGVFTAAAIYWLIRLARKAIFFILISSSIWAICHRGENAGIRETLCAVTCNWKETFTIPVINKAIRTTFHQIYVRLKENTDNLPDIFHGIADIKVLGGVIGRVLDYADECVLAWCYSHNDGLLQECLNGIAVFIKNIKPLTAHMVSSVLIQYFVRMIFTICYVIGILCYIDVTLCNAIPIFIIYKLIAFVICDALIEPLMCSSIVKKYLAFEALENAEVDLLLTQIGSFVDIVELENLVKGGYSHGRQGRNNQNSA